MPLAEIESVSVVMRLYAAPFSRFMRFRNVLAVFLARSAELLIRLSVFALCAGMAVAVVMTVVDYLDFDLNDALPLIVVCVLVFGFLGWRLGGLFANDVCWSLAEALSVPRDSSWFHILLIRTEDGDVPLLANTEFRAIDRLKQTIAGHLEQPGDEPLEVEIAAGNWVDGDRIEIAGDRILFRSEAPLPHGPSVSPVDS